jgi:hypothetical protein
MKNTLLVALFFCAGALMAQSNGPAQAVKTNTFGLMAGQYQLGYEHQLSDKLSVQMSAGIIVGKYSITDTYTNELATSSKSGFILIPEVRFYPGGDACDGLYLAALGRYRTVTNAVDDVDWRSRTAIGAAAVIGYQYYGDGVMIDFFLGPQFKNVEEEYFDDTFEEEEALFTLGGGGTGVRFGVNIGFGWGAN